MTIKLTETDYKRLRCAATAQSPAKQPRTARKRCRRVASPPAPHSAIPDWPGIQVWVEGAAVPWGLSRAGRIHTRPDCVAWQRQVYKAACRPGIRTIPYSGPVALELWFHGPGKGDLTNLVKAVEDAICGRISGQRLPGILQDDRQVKRIEATALPLQPPGVRISVRKLEV